MQLAVAATVKGHEVDVQRFDLTDATSTVISGNSPSGVPVQEITLDFARVTETYQPYTSAGHKLSPVVVKLSPHVR